MIDEDPSPEDIARFGGEDDQSGYCPECGAEIWDDMEQCPTCRQWIRGASSRQPQEAWWRQRWAIAIAVIFVIIFIVYGLRAF